MLLRGILLVAALLLWPDQGLARTWLHVLRTSVQPAPWPRRTCPTPPHPWQGLARPAAWPEEPQSPPRVDSARFSAALQDMCRRVDPARVQRYARWIREYAGLHGIDPFLLAAVIYRNSRCAADHESKFGTGLGRVPWATHVTHVHDGWYRYWTLEDGGWHPHELLVNRFPFSRRSLRRPESNIYFTAALLYVYRRQCRSIDAVTRGEPHRHFVSHYMWGDRVLGGRYEDLVLQARRRMLRLYRGPAPPELARARLRGIALYSPLDGVPRKVSSGFHDPRPNGRRHRGIDFVSTYGEPVRAVADGVVVFAGIDHPRGGASNLSPSQARHVPRRRMGIGGLFVLIDHGHGVTSGYFHLAGYRVREGTRVKAGQLVGFVGSTGIKESPPHLHFEIRIGGHKVDPARRLRPYLAPPEGRARERRRPSV